MTLRTALHEGKRHITDLFHGFAEEARDIYAALHEECAMDPERRRVDEYKIAAGGALSGFGFVELSPLAVAGGLIPVAEALHDLEVNGHQWRARHGRIERPQDCALRH